MPLKEIQYLLHENNFQPKFIDRWNTVFDAEINWKNHWKCSIETPLSNKEKQLHWKIIHNAIFTEHKLSLIGRSKGKCHFCKTETEYLTHLFCECAVIQSALTNINNKINTILEQVGHEHVKFGLKNVILGFDYDTVQNVQNGHVRIYLNTVLQMVKWEIWKIRNIIKYENIFFQQHLC